MRLLLDTHAFVWWIAEPQRLPAHVLSACEDGANELLLSVASILEMQIKTQMGKLELDLPLEKLVTREEQANRVTVLPVRAAHVYAIERLPSLHKDPFDRLLVAQALVEDARIITSDKAIAGYPAEVLW